MNPNWNNTAPVHEQLRERTVAMILDGSLKPGEPLPSIRSAAVDLRVNPVIVARAYESMLKEALVEDRREAGVFIGADAPERLLAAERKRFLEEKLPAIQNEMNRLGLEFADLGQTGYFQ